MCSRSISGAVKNVKNLVLHPRSTDSESTCHESEGCSTPEALELEGLHTPPHQKYVRLRGNHVSPFVPINSRRDEVHSFVVFLLTSWHRLGRGMCITSAL